MNKPNKIITQDGITKLITFSNTYGQIETVIDEEDIEKIKKYHWRAIKGTTVNGYYFGTGQIKILLLHRYLMNCPDELQVDHINRNILDNRKQNLRCVTAYENVANRSTTLTKQSGYKYVYWNKVTKQWVVRIMKNYRQKYIGCRKDLQEAVKLRDDNL